MYINIVYRLFCRANGGTEEECRVTRVNAFLYMLNAIGIGVEGIFLFIFFGLSKRNFRLWKFWLLEKTKGTPIAGILTNILSDNETVSLSGTDSK